jgi:cyclic 2,3-diphosphoglycerate synthetase
MRVLALVDGEHYPPVTRWGIQAARTMGHEVLAALFLGGTEKIGLGEEPEFGVPTIRSGPDIRASLASAIDDVGPEGVLDLSDEPVVGYRERMELAAVALARGVSYMGADFRLDPPQWAERLPVPTVAVIGTGKRTGKTAVAGEVARVAARMGLRPVVVAMGRGGPAAPQVVDAAEVSVESLIERAERGEHAASDYLEDALMAGVTAIGARRCGGGLAGMPFVTNAREAGEVAVRMGAGIVILEGSGSSIPPLPWDAGILVAPADLPPEYLGGYLGPLRVLLSDLVVVTMSSGPNVRPENLSALRSHVQRLHEDAQFAVTDFSPQPVGDVRDKTVFLATTAPDEAAGKQAAHLQSEFGCRVIGYSGRLADRAALRADMEGAGSYEVLVTELKAAAVDVAAREARSRGADVVFLDNRIVTADGEPSLPALLERVLTAAVDAHRGTA